MGHLRISNTQLHYQKIACGTTRVCIYNLTTLILRISSALDIRHKPTSTFLLFRTPYFLYFRDIVNIRLAHMKHNSLIFNLMVRGQHEFV